MKRALAERAKQSLPPSSGTSSSPDVPRQKVPRLEAPPNTERLNSIKNSSTTTTPSSPLHSRRNSRIQALTAAVGEQDDDEASSFYLKHQNRALATELQSLQFAVTGLEKERDYRRQQCLAACQALNSLQATWTQLETALAQTDSSNNSPTNSAAANNNPSILQATTPGVASTGNNKHVEWTGALADSLAALAHGSEEPPPSVEAFYADLSQLSANVAARANTMQEWIWNILKDQQKSTLSTEQQQPPAALLAERNAAVAKATAQSRLLEQQLAETQASREALVAKERRLRRNVYRLSCGMLTAQQVVKALDMDDDEDRELAAQVKLEQQQQPATSDAAVKKEEANDVNSRVTDDNSISNKATAAKVQQMESRIQHLEQIIVNRDKSIQELTDKIKEKELEVNKLSLTQQSEEDTEKLQSLAATQMQLETKEQRVQELEKNLAKTKEKWAQTMGNEKAALDSVDEQVQKFQKRWAEITNGNGELEDNPVQLQLEAQSKQIAELQHKLDQALENVRQAASTRAALAEAIELNEQLQRKQEELKSVNTTLQEGSARDAAGDEAPSSGNHTPREKGHGSSSSSSIDQYREKYKKARKDLAAMTASRDSAKSKFQRADKERDSLLQTNSRLLKQSTEKEEMNAKSLSTILHLKSLTEQLTLEKDNLEQQAKNASQLALAARLATNAKGRLSEELVKEKDALEERLQGLEKEHSATRAQLEKISREWSEGSGEMTTIKSKLSNSMKRCEELVTENDAKQQEIRQLVDSLDKAEREAKAAQTQLKSISQSTGGGASSFTVGQLNTQISVLKARLACPVCHYRDKECIIMRCRHMHCKQCVDERISNRSRKCPTCNNKFSEKDVEDVWLS